MTFSDKNVPINTKIINCKKNCTYFRNIFFCENSKKNIISFVSFELFSLFPDNPRIDVETIIEDNNIPDNFWYNNPNVGADRKKL